MICPRCHGLMVTITLMDEEGSASYLSYGWRCALCGEVIDPTIADNRKVTRKPLRLKPPPRHPTPQSYVLISESAKRAVRTVNRPPEETPRATHLTKADSPHVALRTPVRS